MSRQSSGNLSPTNSPYPLGLLWARRERPSCSATEQRDELAPLHSITSSARPQAVDPEIEPCGFRGFP